MNGSHSAGGRGLPPAMPSARTGGSGGIGGGGGMLQQSRGSGGGGASPKGTMSAPPSTQAGESVGVAGTALEQLRQHAGEAMIDRD